MYKLIIALLVGVAASILIAPAKDSVTREKLMDGFNDWKGSKKNLYLTIRRQSVTIHSHRPK